eukprot:7980494-Ditylum_brightwellii.AAC.1
MPASGCATVRARVTAEVVASYRDSGMGRPECAAGPGCTTGSGLSLGGKKWTSWGTLTGPETLQQWQQY